MRNVFKYGTAYKFHTISDYVVGKTGTSNNARDNWFCGFSDELTLLVWVGTDDPEGFSSKVSASKLALPIWADFMQSTIAGKRVSPKDIPDGIVKEKVNPRHGNLDPNGITMYFIEGRQPEASSTNFSTLQKREAIETFSIAKRGVN